jgi:hypothetical protein
MMRVNMRVGAVRENDGSVNGAAQVRDSNAMWTSAHSSMSAMEQPSTTWCGPMVCTVGSCLANALPTHRRHTRGMPTQDNR